MTSFQRIEIVTARKQHKCCECHKKISAGEKYQYAFVVSDDDISVFKTCVSCVSAIDWLMSNSLIDDEFYFTTLKELLIFESRNGTERHRSQALKLLENGFPQALSNK